jgi:hypothetical protein
MDPIFGPLAIDHDSYLKITMPGDIRAEHLGWADLRVFSLGCPISRPTKDARNPLNHPNPTKVANFKEATGFLARCPNFLSVHSVNIPAGHL